MLNFLRRRFDELVTGSFLFLILILVPLWPPVFGTPGGRAFSQWTLSVLILLFVLLLIAARFTPRARPLLRIVLEIGPMLVGVLGYVSLKLFHASDLTAWFGIPSLDRWMMAADIALFGKTPYLWFSQWGLDSRPFIQVMTCFYSIYPLTPLIALSWFMFKGDMEQLRLVRRAVLISLYLGYCCYILLPVSGPLSLTTPATPLFIQSTLPYTFLMANFRYAYDCFPSLHTANPWLIVWLCRGKLPRWLMAVAVTVCIGITLSTIALRFHYAIDDLAGLVWAYLIALLARASLPRETAL
jgi:membrane-associated phospholipid phosphatase